MMDTELLSRVEERGQHLPPIMTTASTPSTPGPSTHRPKTQKTKTVLAIVGWRPMNFTNLAIVIGPNIMYPADESPQDALGNASSVNTVIRHIFELHDSVLVNARLKFSE